ncbi:MAG: hypothetical protein A2V87_00365 [Deltaproteobacteria bacterium RBG_16_58_17]|nr:MAG: hypothetical protein A2V87_00365 [Deltaproteobacteria bacterium RBG_16_58_17]
MRIFRPAEGRQSSGAAFYIGLSKVDERYSILFFLAVKAKKQEVFHVPHLAMGDARLLPLATDERPQDAS